MRRQVIRLVFLAGLPAPPAVPAQVPALVRYPVARDRWWASSVLDWTTVLVLVGADSGRGVYILAHGKQAGALRPAQYAPGTHYAPADVVAWLPTADSVLHAPPPDSADPRKSVQTLFLPNRAGGGVMLGRLRRGAGWDASPILYFAGADGKGELAVQGDSMVARSFLNALERAAAMSAEREAGPDEARRYVCDQYLVPKADDSVNPGWTPVSLKKAPRPKYPAGLEVAHIGGLVRVRYLVLGTGRADTASADVQFATHARFVESVLEALARAEFVPARLDGVPVPACVEQTIKFVTR
jgi:hypothetical protein